MKIEEAMEAVGLTRAESKIYVALLSTGGSTISGIIRETGLHSSVAYNSIQRLQNKGFVSYNILGKRKSFFAADLTMVKELLKERYAEFEKTISEIERLKSGFGPQQDVSVFEGANSIKMFLRDVFVSLSRGNEHLVLGVSSSASGFGKTIRVWDEKRIKKGIRKRVLISGDGGEWREFYEKRRLTHVKTLPKLYDSGMTINIYGDKSALVIWGKSPTTIMLKNKEVTRNFRHYFELLWSMSK